MIKPMEKAKELSGLISSFVFLAIGILICSSSAWAECTSCGNCPPPVIGFTSKQMSISGNQTITANGGMGPYSWAKASGGGSLSGSSGTSVTYTAPSSNDGDCSNDPIIRVTDACDRSAYLKLAINGYFTDTYAPAYSNIWKYNRGVGCADDIWTDRKTFNCFNQQIGYTETCSRCQCQGCGGIAYEGA